ncbi:MAG: hypothetical protein RLZ14_1864 [Actinomycetota bacterium]
MAGLPVLVLAVFYAWPLGTLLARVLRGSSFGSTLGNTDVLRVLWFTLWQAAASTVATVLVGFAPAYVLARFRFRGRAAVRAVVTVPFMLPTVVVGAAFLAVLPRSLHGTVLAVLVAHVFFNVAVMVRVVGAAWSVLPLDLTAAARTLGANESKVLRHVVLPLLRPALLAAASVIFLFTFTSFGVVKLLGGPAHPTLEVEIVRRATQLGQVDIAAVLALLQLLVLGVVLWWTARWQRANGVATSGGSAQRGARGRRQRALVLGTAAMSVAFVAVPLVVLAAMSFRVGGRWSLTAWSTLGSGEVRPGITLGVNPWASMLVSLRYAVVATLLATVVGALAAVAITSARRSGRLLDVGLLLPLGTSAVTIGLGMLITFDNPPFDWRGRWWLVPVGHALVALPFVVRSVVPALRAVSPEQRWAAATLGASPWRAWWEVQVRRMLRPLAAAAGFAAAISLGEFGATSFLTRSGHDSVPVAIDHLLGRAGTIPRAQAFALATLLLLLTGTIVTLADRNERADA